MFLDIVLTLYLCCCSFCTLEAYRVLLFVCIPYQVVLWFDPQDMSRGMEAIPILVCDPNIHMIPFRYMPTSKVHDKASPNFSLFTPKIGYCCDCGTDDCLMVGVSYGCRRSLGGQIAYEEGGVGKDLFPLSRWSQL